MARRVDGAQTPVQSRVSQGAAGGLFSARLRHILREEERNIDSVHVETSVQQPLHVGRTIAGTDKNLSLDSEKKNFVRCSSGV